MLNWPIARALDAVTGRLNQGDPSLMVRMFADDVTFVFPGDSSWAGEYRGKEEIRAFLDRFVSSGLRITIDEVLSNGWPWDLRLAVRYHDVAHGPDGALVYENDGFIYDRIRWGRIVHHEVLHRHPGRIDEFDSYLAGRDGPGS